MLAKFLRGHARRAGHSHRRIRDKAVELLVKEYPNLKRDDELEGSRRC